MNKTYTVQGMTCQHCVMSVTEEVSDIAGVEKVDVDLATGRLTVTAPEIDDAAVAAAVSEAGYALAAPGDLGIRPA
ncbi:heavy-metal-associated domain-containing protein [Microbacterium excoecariae]|uniref:heavy-metal-associated domain-containing protein n=1 Tax=Microbacterium excoecariae TaxID=2715210 RepID=UPI00140E375B|nr:cation transporter [Microbacterium excoecariae]NHI15608.1 heavy-metal-associated domain-containing protein [Microbacterium excoecariae]